MVVVDGGVGGGELRLDSPQSSSDCRVSRPRSSVERSGGEVAESVRVY